MTDRILLRDVELDGRRTDVEIAGSTIRSIGRGLPTTRGTTVLDGGGGALLPGLHDHHIHLLALAARSRSVSARSVSSPSGFDEMLAAAARRVHDQPSGERWVRIVDHEDERCGAVDRHRLDRLAGPLPVRVQHRSGALWTLDSAALHAIGLDPDAEPSNVPPGVELDDDRRPTGRMWRVDEWLRSRLPPSPPPDLADVGRQLAGVGITGVTDATPFADPASAELIAGAVRTGQLPKSVTVTGGVALAGHHPPPPLVSGPVKIVVADHEPADPDEIAERIAIAHRAGRPVAVHCVTRVALAVTVAAWDITGCAPGDRVEHAGIADRELVAQLAAGGIRVVTQPAFVHERGDHYLREVDASDIGDLYRCASLLDAGVLVAGSSDAPHGAIDPWLAIATATTRLTSSGAALGPNERIAPRRALDLYLAPPDDPGGRPRRVGLGAPADVCVLDRPLADALDDPASVTPVLTIATGVITHRATR